MEQEESGLFTLLGQDTEELRFLLTRANHAADLSVVLPGAPEVVEIS